VVVDDTEACAQAFVLLPSCQGATLRNVSGNGEVSMYVQAALPSAPPPEQQTVRNAHIWYTTLGRLLEPPHVTWSAAAHGAAGSQAVQAAARSMSAELCGLETVIDRLWYLLEHDLMALALNGMWSSQDAPLARKNCG
jgi:hypothetical protein